MVFGIMYLYSDSKVNFFINQFSFCSSFECRNLFHDFYFFWDIQNRITVWYSCCKTKRSSWLVVDYYFGNCSKGVSVYHIYCGKFWSKFFFQKFCIRCTDLMDEKVSYVTENCFRKIKISS